MSKQGAELRIRENQTPDWQRSSGRLNPLDPDLGFSSLPVFSLPLVIFLYHATFNTSCNTALPLREMVRPKHAREADPSDTSHLQSPAPPEPRGKSNKKPPDYGDHSSTYWTPGWNYRRFSKANHDELDSLPEEELLKIQAGMREALGEDGVTRWSNIQFEEEMKKNPDYRDPLLDIPPNFVSQWRKRYLGQEWGFVAFRTACYDDEDQWRRFKKQWDEKLERFFDFFEGAPGVEEAKAKFCVHWIEDVRIDGADIEQLRQSFNPAVMLVVSS